MVSIIIPTYRPKKYLWECLYSLEVQTISKDSYEVIIVLNGDKEPFFTEIKDYSKSSNLNLRLYHTINKGVSCARNIGIEKAKGEYVVFIDDDDKITNNYIENLLETIGNRSNCIAVSNVLTFNEDGNIGEDYITEAFKSCKKSNSKNLFLMRRFLSTVWCKIIPINIIGSTRFNPNFALGEDSLFMASISDKVDDLILSSKSTIYYRRLREGSASRSEVKLKNLFQNKCSLISEYIRLYFSNFRKYNLLFFLSRIVAQIINR